MAAETIVDYKSFSRLFPFGSHLCREPMPSMTELKKDMENLKRHGFNLIKLQEHWGLDEPREGVLDFSRYEELIEYAGRLDLGIYLGLTCEQAPAWLFQKYPDCRMVGKNGVPIAYEATGTLPADGKPGPCYDHPQSMEAQLRFIESLVKTLGRHENIVVWNTWQEVSYWSEMLAGQSVCYCEHTVSFFQSWLKEKYGDLDELNRRWNSRYADWRYVFPERRPTGKTCLPTEIEWNYFMDHIQIGNVLKTRAEAIRKADPFGRPVFAHKGGPEIGSDVDWTYARCQDFLGTSCYPAWGPYRKWDDGKPKNGASFNREHALLMEMWEGVALRFDYIRSCGPEGSAVWAAEFQGGPVSTSLHKGRIPSKDDIRRWVLTAVASGITALSFWVTRAEIAAAETNGFSLLDSEGDTTGRLEEASRIGKALNKYPDLFGAPTLQPSEVGILINEEGFQTCKALDDAEDHIVYSVRGWHKLLWNLGIPADFVSCSYSDDPALSRYKALILPFPLSLPEKTADILKTYVEQGGSLLSEACPGRLNEYGYANRGELSPSARRLFGVDQLSVQLIREPPDSPRWMPPERTWGEFADAAFLDGTGVLEGEKLRANFYIENFICTGSIPILMYGDRIAGIERQLGKGTARLIGTFVGHSGTAYCSEQSGSCVRKLLERCGVRPAHDGKLLLRRRGAGDREALIFTNPTSNRISEPIDTTGITHIEELFGEPVTVDGNTATVVVDSLDVKVLVTEGIMA